MSRRQPPPTDRCPFCDKRAYRSRRRAKERAVAIHRADGSAMSWYRCPHGLGWHVGHTPIDLQARGKGVPYDGRRDPARQTTS